MKISQYWWIGLAVAACPACDMAETLSSADGVHTEADGGSEAPEPVYENCFNGRDDNGDLLIDCADPDCRSLDVCREFDCPDGVIGEAIGYPAFEANTEGATNNLSGSCGGQGGEELALLWTAPADGDYWIDTRGQSYDTVLYVVDGCDGEELACNDDATLPPSLRSEVLLTAERGHEYLIVVDGYDVVNGPDGDAFQLNITPTFLESEIGFCTDGRDNDEDGALDCDDDDCIEFEACLPMEGVIEIAAGPTHTCASTEDTTFCWGSGGAGQIGDGDRLSSARPRPLEDRWYELSAGSDLTCASDEESALFCWGSTNWNRLLRPFEDGNAFEPTRVGAIDITDISVSWSHACAVTESGGVACWGYNGSGQLGSGETGGAQEEMSVVDIASVRAVDTGAQTSCAVKTDDSLWCWGGNGNRMIDDSGEWTVLIPTRIMETVVSVATGDNHLCALLEDGQIRCQGANWNGQLGNGRSEEARSAVIVFVPNVATSLGCGSAHCCAIDEFGTAWCWGLNGWGQLGIGDTSQNELGPIEVEFDGTFASVSVSQHTSCALTESGHAWCWGANSSGQLGDSTRTNSPRPRRVLRQLVE